MTATNRTEAERLIVEFLDANDHPTAADWKSLADKHPEHASAFVDAALVRAVGDAADASAEPYEFDASLATQMVSKGLTKLHQTSIAPRHAPAFARAIEAANGIKGDAP